MEPGSYEGSKVSYASFQKGAFSQWDASNSSYQEQLVFLQLFSLLSLTSLRGLRIVHESILSVR